MSKILDKIVLRDTKTGISTEYTIQDTQLKERVEHLIANKNDTNGNSELIDIRTGFDGNKYDTAGDAVRSQVSNLQEQVNDINNNGLIFNDDYISLKIDTWLKDHPEATTTVLDNSITKEKIEEDFLYDLRKARFYNSVADMKVDSELKAGQVCKTLGYYSINDGGGAYYTIREKANGDVDDGGSVHELANGLVAELIIENGTVNVKQFGAKGDGVTDDSIVINNAITKAIEKILYFPHGNYLCSNTLNLSRGVGGEKTAPRITKGAGLGTRITAKNGLELLINAKDLTNRQIENLWLFGNGNENCMLLDTSVNFSAGAPSTQNKYYNIRLSNYGKIGWLANHNNDVAFERIAGEGPFDSNSVCVKSHSNGGYLSFDDCFSFDAPFSVCGQNITFKNCSLGGIDIIGYDYNNLSIFGGYLYPNRATKNNINISDGIQCDTISLFGCHIENVIDGNIIGGNGKLWGNVSVQGGHLFSTNGNCNFISETTKVISIGLAKFNGVSIRDIVFTERTNFKIEINNCSINGYPSNDNVKLVNQGLHSVYDANQIQLSKDNHGTYCGLNITSAHFNCTKDTPIEIVDIHYGCGILMVSHSYSKTLTSATVYAIAKNDYNRPVITTLSKATAHNGDYTLQWVSDSKLTLTPSVDMQIVVNFIG